MDDRQNTAVGWLSAYACLQVEMAGSKSWSADTYSAALPSDGGCEGS